MIIKTTLPEFFGAAGLAIWPFIFMIDPDDEALVAHEMTHYKEQVKYLVIFWWIFYLFSKKFRLNAEVKAYKVQIQLGGLTVNRAAYYLSTMYKLGITQEEAEALLK